MGILEIIAALDLIFTRCRQLMESMKNMSFLDLDPNHLNIKVMAFSEITGPMKLKYYVEPPCVGEQNFVREIWVECSKGRHSHKYSTMLESLISRTGGPIFTKHGMQYLRLQRFVIFKMMAL